MKDGSKHYEHASDHVKHENKSVRASTIVCWMPFLGFSRSTCGAKVLRIRFD